MTDQEATITALREALADVLDEDIPYLGPIRAKASVVLADTAPAAAQARERIEAEAYLKVGATIRQTVDDEVAPWRALVVGQVGWPCIEEEAGECGSHLSILRLGSDVCDWVIEARALLATPDSEDVT